MSDQPQPDQPIDASTMRIFIADDNAANIALLRELLDGAGYRNLTCVQDPIELVKRVQEQPPDLLLLDLHMPMMNGFEVMAELRPLLKHPHYLPILVVTADATVPAKRRALSFGARDFVTKPIDATEVLLRVRNQLQMRRLQNDLAGLVEERTRELEEARRETLSCLARACGRTADRAARRVERSARLIAERLGLPADEARAIGQAAPLYDIRPEIFGDSQSSVLAIAAQVARDHRAHWDGSGEPRGLGGERIPVAARIAAVAVAFDSLTHADDGVVAIRHDEAVLQLRRDAGSRFDPEVVRAVSQLEQELLTDAALPAAA